ncbi:SLC13 family permease [Mycobacterium sp.]|uniref:SLC13 family permease n=1 Tax=Mycobacterium sp. TaxID=1785 RepID=UPI002D98B5F7|nr:SLC13 family permease [Mycobacterium sp.]
MAVTLALVALILVLGFAMVRPRGWPEAVVAAPAAALLIAFGVISLHDAAAEVGRLLPVVGFLAAVLVLARLCDDEGLFHAAGVAMARASSASQHRLLAVTFVIAAATTAILSLDATVVLLTPVVLATVRALAIPVRAHAYATAHLANSASLLFPVSNLTNLLAFTAAGMTFVHFTAVMALPWLAAIAVEFILLRWLFRRDLAVKPRHDTTSEAPEVPVFVLVVLAATLIGFAVTSLFEVSPAWAALAGAIVLGVRSLAQHRSTPAGILDAVNAPFLVFVLCLGVVVDALMRHGLDDVMRAVLPTGSSLAALLGIAAMAAVLSNVVNNLPAVLVLLPLVGGAPAILAVLIGVNIGPNLTYVGSLANLLWRSVVHREGIPAGHAEFTRVGLFTVPLTLVAAVVCLWAALKLFGV